jgi:hypothetical protein
MALVANCIRQTKHRRRKNAVRSHLNLMVHSFTLVKNAEPGDMLTRFAHASLGFSRVRGVAWGTRAKPGKGIFPGGAL